MAQPGTSLDQIHAVLGDREVAVRGPVLLVQLDHPAIADLDAQVFAFLGHGTIAEEHAHVEPADLRESLEGEDVGLIGPNQPVRIGDDQLLAAPGGDRKDAGRELIARLLLQQRRVLPPVEEILVGLPGALALHHLPLLPGVADLHGEAGEGRARRQGDAEPPLDRLIAGVLERQVQLGEGEGRLQDSVRLQGDQSEPRAVRGREADGSNRLPGLRLFLGLREPERSRGEFRGGRGGRTVLGIAGARCINCEAGGETDGSESEQANQRGSAGHRVSSPKGWSGPGLGAAQPLRHPKWRKRSRDDLHAPSYQVAVKYQRST